LPPSTTQLAEAQRITQQMIEALPNPIFFTDIAGRYIGVNKAWEDFFGIPRNACIGKTVYDLNPGNKDLAARLDAMDKLLRNTPGTQVYETAITTPDGRRHDTICYKATYNHADGSIAGLIGTIIDITERKQAEKRQTMEHAITRALAEGGTLADTVPRIIRTICETMGWHCGARWAWDKQANTLRCCEYWSIDAPEIQEFVAASSQRAVNPAPADQGLVQRILTTCKPLWITDITGDQGFGRGTMAARAGLHGAFGFPLVDGNETLGLMEFFHRDIREPDETVTRIAQSIGGQIGQYVVRKETEETINFVATHDTMTGLPNRVLFGEVLSHAISTAVRNNRRLAILFIDLDRFKVINDTLGHDTGDALLREVATRLTVTLRASDTVARLGGDEFVILVEELTEPIHVGTLARKLIAELSKSYTLSGQEFHVSASIGISTYPDDATDMLALLKNADIAMYRAKEQGRNTFQFYSEKTNTHSVERLALESNLRHAIERNELVLHYQPQVDIRSGRIIGVEALVRWQHPAMGLVSPAKFIPLAEETGMIVPIGEWVLQTACAAHQAWEKQGLPHLRIAVNLSPRQFIHGDPLKFVAHALKQANRNPASLELEITESMVMHNPERAVTLIQRLKDVGILVAIDDFGTGYSSLAYLKRFPIDSLKIDRSFIVDIPGDPSNEAITQAIIAMAHSLELNVIAEGVETGDQLKFLRDHGCDQIQGYYFSKPLPAEAMIPLLQQDEKLASAEA